MADEGTDTCHFGLMSFASLASLLSNMTIPFPDESERDLENMKSAVGATRWSDIRYGATWLMNKCVIGSNVGGFKILSSGTSSAFQSDFSISEVLGD